jgi:hypothetical protein
LNLPYRFHEVLRAILDKGPSQAHFRSSEPETDDGADGQSDKHENDAGHYSLGSGVFQFC